MTNVCVLDNTDRLSFGFEDLRKFHGTRSICGLTVSLKIMEAAWEACWADAAPERSEISVQSGFPGPGTRDGFELVTRAASRGTYEVLTDPPTGPMIAEAAKGVYYFRVASADRSVELGLKPEVVPDGFITQRRRLVSGQGTEDDAKSFRQLQFDFSDQLRALAPSEAVNVLSVDGFNR